MLPTLERFIWCSSSAAPRPWGHVPGEILWQGLMWTLQDLSLSFFSGFGNRRLCAVTILNWSIKQLYRKYVTYSFIVPWRLNLQYWFISSFICNWLLGWTKPSSEFRIYIFANRLLPIDSILWMVLKKRCLQIVRATIIGLLNTLWHYDSSQQTRDINMQESDCKYNTVTPLNSASPREIVAFI